MWSSMTQMHGCKGRTCHHVHTHCVRAHRHTHTHTWCERLCSVASSFIFNFGAQQVWGSVPVISGARDFPQVFFPIWNLLSTSHKNMATATRTANSMSMTEEVMLSSKAAVNPAGVKRYQICFPQIEHNTSLTLTNSHPTMFYEHEMIQLIESEDLSGLFHANMHHLLLKMATTLLTLPFDLWQYPRDFRMCAGSR